MTTNEEIEGLKTNHLFNHQVAKTLAVARSLNLSDKEYYIVFFTYEKDKDPSGNLSKIIQSVTCMTPDDGSSGTLLVRSGRVEAWLRHNQQHNPALINEIVHKQGVKVLILTKDGEMINMSLTIDDSIALPALDFNINQFECEDTNHNVYVIRYDLKSEIVEEKPKKAPSKVKKSPTKKTQKRIKKKDLN